MWHHWSLFTTWWLVTEHAHHSVRCNLSVTVLQVLNEVKWQTIWFSNSRVLPVQHQQLGVCTWLPLSLWPYDKGNLSLHYETLRTSLMNCYGFRHSSNCCISCKAFLPVYFIYELFVSGEALKACACTVKSTVFHLLFLIFINEILFGSKGFLNYTEFC